MPVLYLSLLGPFFAALDDQPFYNFKTAKVQALLVYLAMESQPNRRRENLMELLWPGMPLDSAQVNLRQTIYRLRQALPEVNAKGSTGLVPLILADRQFVGIHPDADIRLDVESFLQKIKTEPSRAVELYRGDFLMDFYLGDSNEFEAWAEQNREFLRRQILAALDELTGSLIEQGDYTQAQSFAWRQLEIDNLAEKAYCQLMLALAQDGQRSAALSQYQICQRRLQRDLGVLPSLETTALYEKIQADALHHTRLPSPKQKKSPANEMPVFLLTDIEGSTRLWDTYHQAMLPALLQHNAILEEQINKHGGRILEFRGDGVKAVFEGVNPLSCVIDIKKDFANADWGEIGELKIRMALHGVQAVRRGYDYFKKDDNYYGPVLNHTARIMDSGWGGQILVSENVHHNFALPLDAIWQDFGLHNLKSLDQPVRIYGLVHPDLSQLDYPPLRTSGLVEESKAPANRVPRNNLPPQPTQFVGRRVELGELAKLLEDPGHRLVTIVGPGGMGKTRLAITAGESQIQQCQSQGADCLFPDGIYFVPLAALNKPAQIVPTIALTLQIPVDISQNTDTLDRANQTASTQKQSLMGYLGSKRMLIILDNFEHLIPEVEIVCELLTSGPGLQILVTSRERLHIQEEQIFPIQGLDFPDWESPEDPCDYTAMELFLQSAHRVQPDFELAAGDMVYLTRICRLVGGMPLGLELAASWVDMLSLQEIAAEIQTSLDFLETDVRNMPDRHRSIRAVFESSWGRLDEVEKLIFPRLSIFRGKFTRAAAEQVAQAKLRNLSSLVNKSLVQYDQETHRYQIHELLRQHGAEQLSAFEQDKVDTQQRYSAFYCNEVDQLLKQLLLGQIQVAINQIEIDFTNIMTAWNWAISHANLELVNIAIDGVCTAYELNWRVEEGLSICQSACEMLSCQGWADLPEDIITEEAILAKRLFAKIYCWQGYFTLYYNHEQANLLLAQSQAIADQLIAAGFDARAEKGRILFYGGWVDFLSGDLKQPKSRFDECLSLSREIGVQWMVLRSLLALGDLARNTGAPREAQRWYRECLTESRAQNNIWGEIVALHDLGWAARQMMAYNEAESFFIESYDLSKNQNNQWEMAHALDSLGFLSLFLGDFDQAIDRFSQAVMISTELGMVYRAFPAQVHIGISHWLSGRFAQAEIAILETIRSSQETTIATRIFPAICLAEFQTIMGNYYTAKRQIQMIQTWIKDILLDRFWEGRLLRVQGWIALAEKHYSEARAYFEKSIELYQINSDDEQIAWSQAGLARAMIGQMQWEGARSVLTEALWTSIEIKGMIPLLFTLPITVLYLAYENTDLAASVYQEIQISQFIAKAPYFTDIVTQYLPDLIRNAPPEDVSLVTNTNETLWSIAARVLSHWIQVWMTLPDQIRTDPTSHSEEYQPTNPADQ